MLLSYVEKYILFVRRHCSTLLPYGNGRRVPPLPLRARSHPIYGGGASTYTSASPSELFDQQYTFLHDRLDTRARPPRLTAPPTQIRANALRRLLHHARTREHLERTAEVVKLWRARGRTVDEKTTLEFVGALMSLPSHC